MSRSWWWCLGLLGCEQPTETKETDGNDTGLVVEHTATPTTETGGGTTDTGTTTHSGTISPPASGWRVLPLVDDTSGGDVIQHRGNSQVRGIHFTAPDRGVVATTGQHLTSVDGQAVFSVDDQAVTGIVFRGAGASSCSATGSMFDVAGLTRTSDGYVVLTAACDHVVSRDDGATFQVVNLDLGAETVLAYGEAAGRTVLVRNGFGVSETHQAPGPQTTWTDIWAPYAEDRPLCAWGPQSQLTPVTPQAVWVSDDTSRMAYVLPDVAGPVVCVSDDGGETFLASDVPAGGSSGPHGVLFTDADHGITYYGNRVVEGDSWVYRTADGGRTWTGATLPPGLGRASVEFRHLFFAPGNQVGFLVGERDGGPMLLKTTDGGSTWAESGGDLASVVSAAGGLRLYTGFALDEDHVWVGGEYGVLLANDAGGE